MAKKQKTGVDTAKPQQTEDVSNDSYEESSGEEVDDEFDVDQEVSGSESEQENSDEEESEEEEEDDSFPLRKKKASGDDGSNSFSTAVSAIVGSKLKAYDRADPIMARNKKTSKKLESDKLEAKAKKALLAEKKQLYDKHRVKQLIPAGDDAKDILMKDRQLKKTAQKGVVRLFNAVLSTQVKTERQIGTEIGGVKRKEELMNEISKEQFLDLVQAAGEE